MSSLPHVPTRAPLGYCLISIRSWQWLFFCFLAMGWGVCGSMQAIGAEPTRPNIVIIVSDDQGWGDYGFMGHPHVATPRLDRLAAQSLTFQRGYTPIALCRPSLATILTGLYPHVHGITGNDPLLPAKLNNMAGRQNPKFASYYQTIIDNFARRPNLVKELTHDGYVALQTGKWWEGDPIRTAGFTDAMTAGNKKNDRHGGDGLAIGRQGLEPIKKFIEQAGEKPFFVWYAPMLPHSPHTPPEALLKKYLPLAPNEPVARYWAYVEWFDQTCGELLQYLEDKKLRENTIVVYVTDNGYIQSPTANQFAPRSKLSPYEGGVRTPIMISWPKKITPSMNCTHVASSIDLWPTVAALLNRKVPADLPGVNLTDAQALSARPAIFGEYYPHNIHDVAHPTNHLAARWIIANDWKLIVHAPEGKTPGVELFQLLDDPEEKQNLAEKEAPRVEQMRSQLDRWWKG